SRKWGRAATGDKVNRASIDNQCPQYSEPLINKESPPVVEVPVIEPLAVEKGPASSLYIPTSLLVIASLLIFGVLCYIERCSRFFPSEEFIHAPFRRRGRRKMGNFFRNQPFMLLVIALILIFSTLETRGSHDEAPDLRVQNELMEVTFVWHKNSANLLWVKMNEHQDEVVTITNYHLQSIKEVSVDLSFDFYLFGNKIRKVRLSKHGRNQSFGNHTTSDWYISPVSIKTSRVKHSKIQYMDFGNAFAVQWEFESYDWDRKLSFQAVMHADGRIEFAYKEIPFGSLVNFRKKFQDIKNVIGVVHSYKLPDTTFWLGYNILIE
ncbi:Hypothetical predicted protein, partial [Cloeon dipterum]